MPDQGDSASSPYEMLGGAAGVRRLAQHFYANMERDPKAAAIRAMHAADLSPMAEKLAGFLNGWLGGPRDYFEQPDAPCIMSVHRKFPIGAAERDQWLSCMRAALRQCDAPDEVCAMLEPAFERLANAMRSA